MTGLLYFRADFLRRAAPAFAALAAGLILAYCGGHVMSGIFGQPVSMPPFVAGRLLADGEAQNYLRRACPKAGLVACDLADAPSGASEYYTWVYPLEPPPGRAQPAGPGDAVDQYARLQNRHVTPEQAAIRSRYIAEQPQLLWGALRTDPSGMARQIAANGLAAFLNFGVGASFDTVAMLRRSGAGSPDALLPGGVACVRPNSAACGRYDLARLAPVQYAAALIASAVLIVFSLHPRLRLTGDEGRFCLLLLALLLANAFICGNISGPFARYQARVEWVLPMAALLLAARRFVKGPVADG